MRRYHVAGAALAAALLSFPLAAQQGAEDWSSVSGGKHFAGGVTVDTGDVVITAGDLTMTAGAITGDITGDVTGNLTGNVTGNVTGNLSSSGANLLTGGAAAAAVILRLGDTATEGLELRVIDETTAVLAGVSTDLTQDIPDSAVILSVQGNVESALTGGGTTTNWAIGTTADPDLYSPTVGDLTKNSKIDYIPDWSVTAGAVDINIKAVTAAGAIGDTALTVGTVRVRIVYLTVNSLDDAP